MVDAMATGTKLVITEAEEVEETAEGGIDYAQTWELRLSQ